MTAPEQIAFSTEVIVGKPAHSCTAVGETLLGTWGSGDREAGVLTETVRHWPSTAAFNRGTLSSYPSYWLGLSKIPYTEAWGLPRSVFGSLLGG